jgi:elongation factor G
MPRHLDTIRNIGIVAHIDAGKTTLTERMLFFTKTSHRLGEVDRGTTITDFDPEEQERGITIYSAAVSFQWRDVNVNLIDTPGHVDFTAEVERSLRVLDGAVVVFSAREGVEAQSETVWRQADKYGVPRIALVNKLDREGADFFGTVDQIEKRLNAKPLVLHVPQGMGPPHVKDPFRGIVDLVEMQLLTFPPKDEALAGGAALTAIARSPIPAELADVAAEYREQLVSTLFDVSDEIAELAMQEGAIPPDLMRKAIRQATIARTVVPVLCGSALDCIGIQPVLDPSKASIHRSSTPRRALRSRSRGSPTRRRRSAGSSSRSSPRSTATCISCGSIRARSRREAGPGIRCGRRRKTSPNCGTCRPTVASRSRRRLPATSWA